MISIMHEWRVEAECRDMDTDLFFPPAGISGERKYELERIAVNICNSCTVIDECLEFAVGNPQLVAAGVWGGKTDDEIQKMQRRRKRRGRRK